jgi:hypothetical protein
MVLRGCFIVPDDSMKGGSANMIFSNRHCRNTFVFLLLLIVLAVPQTVSVSAADQPQQNYATSVYGSSEASIGAIAMSGGYVNPLIYQMSEDKQKSSQKRSSTDKAYANLGFSRIDAAALSRYIDVEEISEKEFYHLNFNMKIAAVAMTTEGTVMRILMRTPAGRSSLSPNTMKITLTATKPIMANAQYFIVRNAFTLACENVLSCLTYPNALNA